MPSTKLVQLKGEYDRIMAHGRDLVRRRAVLLEEWQRIEDRQKQLVDEASRMNQFLEGLKARAIQIQQEAAVEMDRLNEYPGVGR